MTSAPLPLLAALARLYQWGAAARGALAAKRAESSPIPVVSIGNLCFGGAGKTPAAAWMIDQLAARGRRPALLSRGYGGTRAAEPLLVARSGEILVPASASGDEPQLIARATKAHVVVVARRRIEAARLAAREGADVAVLDDGFQHRALRRALDVVLLDAAWSPRARAASPADLLREGPRALRRAGAILLAGAPEELGAGHDGPLRADEVPAPIAALFAGAAAPPLFFAARRRPTTLTLERAAADDGPATNAPGSKPALVPGEAVPATVLEGKLILAVSGVARPERFAASLRALGAIVAAHVVVPDHHAYDAADAATIRRRAEETSAALVVTTAKDAVRWPAGAPAPAVLREEFLVRGGEALVDLALRRCAAEAAAAGPPK